MLRKLTSDSAWLALAVAFGRSSTLLASLLIVRWLGQESYGIIALLQSTVLMAGGFVGLGFGMAATKLVAELRDEKPLEAGGVILLFEISTLATATTAALLLWSARGWLVQQVLVEPRMLELMLPGVMLLVLTSWNLFQAGILAGLGEFRTTAIANAISGIASIPITIAGVLLGGLKGAVMAQLIAMIFSCGVYLWFINRLCLAAGIHRSWSFAYGCHPLLLKLGIPAMLLNAINAPTDWITFAILARQADGVSEVGIYGAANQWCVVLRFLPLMMSSALLPMASKIIANRSDKECRRLVWSGLGLSGLLSIPPAVLVGLMSPTIFRFYGGDLEHHWHVLATLAATSCFIAVQITADRFVLSFGAAWSSFALGLGRSLILIGAFLLFLPYGAQGLAIARLGAFGFGAIACSLLALRHLANSTQAVEAVAEAGPSSSSPQRALRAA